MALQKRGFIALVHLLVALTVIISANQKVYGQRIEVFGGGNMHHLRVGERLYQDADYQHRTGYTVGAGIANLRVARIPLRATLQVETNRSEFYQRSGGMGGGYSITAASHRTLMTAGFYPLNFRFAKNLLLHLGMESSVLIARKTSVKEFSFKISGTPPSTTRYDELEIDRAFGFGFAAEVAWHMNVKEHYFIAPWFRTVISTTDPFINTIYLTRMVKVHGGISVIRRLGFD